MRCKCSSRPDLSLRQTAVRNWPSGRFWQLIFDHSLRVLLAQDDPGCLLWSLFIHRYRDLRERTGKKEKELESAKEREEQREKENKRERERGREQKIMHMACRMGPCLSVRGAFKGVRFSEEQKEGIPRPSRFCLFKRIGHPQNSAFSLRAFEMGGPGSSGRDSFCTSTDVQCVSTSLSFPMRFFQGRGHKEG